MKIRFMVNDVVPGFGLPSSAPAMRAWGLVQGLRSLGVDAGVIQRQYALKNRLKRWDGFAACSPPDWVEVVTVDTLPEAVANADVVVFHNWNAADNVEKDDACTTRFVYDFFSPTLVENAFINPDAEHLRRLETRKRAVIRKADIYIANGAGRQAYGQDFLAGMGIDAPVHDIAMSLPWLGDAPEMGAVLIGGYRQFWTRPVSADVLHDLAGRMPTRDLITVGAELHHHFGRQDSAPAREAPPANLTAYDVLSFEDYRRINARCGAFVDISPLNAERLMSFSTRAIVSIASGCPVIHNADTELGGLLDAYGAGVTLGAEADLADPDVLHRAVEQTLDRSRRAACHALWQERFDSTRNARRLLDILEGTPQAEGAQHASRP